MNKTEEYPKTTQVREHSVRWRIFSQRINLLKMGMFDSVYVKCPKCETENEFQGKSGDCFCLSYTLDNCPEDVLLDVNRHSPCRCQCGILFAVDIENRKPIELNKENQI